MQRHSHGNILLVYHGVGGLMTIVWWKNDTVSQLRMSKLNDSRRLLVKVGALEDHKQLILAIASGRVERMAPLQYERATEKLYKPKGYTNKDIMRSIVLLQLGGARVAEFAHRSLALPSLTTIHRNTVLPPWFQGTCREHNHRIPLDFMSERELELLCDAIEKDEVHLASEATVAAIGMLSSDSCKYAARPIMFLGTCKKERSEEHMQLIKTILRAWDMTHCTICIASDGEAKRGDSLLNPLKFLNLLVGPDDITADKDHKHIIKRQWNTLMCKRGIEVLL
ncbi:hypothetical protein BJV77DRAFT_1062507 [Russula vinacea]|nr:hypothetical protein BJV77DRAFT_1062507 [Russula vinacea]